MVAQINVPKMRDQVKILLLLKNRERLSRGLGSGALSPRNRIVARSIQSIARNRTRAITFTLIPHYKSKADQFHVR
jgi:hypothetical protein